MRVLVVDDQELMRRGLTMLLDIEDDIEVVAQAADGQQALAAVRGHGPDVVLTDARMPGMDGVALTEAMATAHPQVPVIVLTTFDDDALVQDALAAGASGFMLKDSSTDDLVHAIRSVRDGGLVLDPRVARAAVGRGRSGARGVGGDGAASTSPLAVLTRAERLVAGQVARGATNSEIAATLVIAEGTVKNHVSALLRKLGQRDRTSLALLLSRSLRPGQDAL